MIEAKVIKINTIYKKKSHFLVKIIPEEYNIIA